MPRLLEWSSRRQVFGRRYAQRGMTSGLAVADPPTFDNPAGLIETAEPVRIKAFVPQAAPHPEAVGRHGIPILKLAIEPFCIGLPLRGLLTAFP